MSKPMFHDRLHGRMLWHADSPSIYRCGDYALHWTTMGWALWNYSRRKAIIGRDLTISEAMELAEQDALRQTS
jgi:hypothetical protein